MNKCKNIRILAILLFLVSACNEDILEKTPLDKYSDANLWTDVNLVSSYLTNCYNSMQVAQCHFMEVPIGSASDELFTARGLSSNPYNLGNMTADNTRGSYYGANWYANSNWGLFSNIQKVNVFLDKIDMVADSYAESAKATIKVETDILKGEALFLRAFMYTQMCRTYGGLPLLSKPNSLNDDFSLITRATFKETVDFIIKDCDAAAALLPLKSAIELGRANKEAALALKSRMLLFAASDLTADGNSATATNLAGQNVGELVGYISPDRAALWTSARNAAKAVMDLGTCQLADFGAPDKEAVAQKYFNFFKAYTLSDNEVIWGVQLLKSLGTTKNINQMQGANGNFDWGAMGPFQGMVDEYEMEDGSKFFDHFYVDADDYIKNKSTKYRYENPYKNREPRFYASILYDSAVWQPRINPALAAKDPLGIYEVRTHRAIAVDGTITDSYGIDTREHSFFPAGGAYGHYLTKKFMDPAIKGYVERNENVAIEFRYAEIILNYAEACLELNDIPEATTYINIVRNRAGLPDFTGDITEALRHERKVELFAEGFRWYDIRRWKIMPQVFVPCGVGINILEVYNAATGKTTTAWRLNRQAQVANKWVESMYWIPIQTTELKKAPQLIQNPGY